jgi:hypothetical protein
MPLEGLLGRKLGMTQVFDTDGTVHAVTVVEVHAGGRGEDGGWATLRRDTGRIR